MRRFGRSDVHTRRRRVIDWNVWLVVDPDGGDVIGA